MPSLLPGHYAAVKVRKELYVTCSEDSPLIRGSSRIQTEAMAYQPHSQMPWPYLSIIQIEPARDYSAPLQGSLQLGIGCKEI